MLNYPIEMHYSISSLSDDEFELQKPYLREHITKTVISTLQLLADLHHHGVFVRIINIDEINPCAGHYPDAIEISTAKPIVLKNSGKAYTDINVAWDVFRNHIIQRVIVEGENSV